MTSLQPHRNIDSSLARSIRRGYFRRLAREWEAYEQRRGRAAGRNVSLQAWMDNRRQFRDRLGLLEKFAGPLLPACTLQIESGTRAAVVVWAASRLPAIELRLGRLCAILARRQVILSDKGEAGTHASMVTGQWLTR